MNRKQREDWLRKKSIGGKLFCLNCGIKVHWYKKPKAIVEHKDNNSTNNADSNIQIFCASCNSLKNPRGKSTKSSTYQPPRRMTQSEATNQRSEEPWLKWLKGRIKFYGKEGYEIEEAVNSGGFHFKISVDTIRYRYLPKYTSRAGPFKVIGDNLFFKLDSDYDCDYIDD